jgi:hypothetical protein
VEHEALADAAAVLGGLGGAGLLLARNRLLTLAGALAIALAEVGLAYALVPEAPGLVVHSPVRLAAVAVAALAVLGLAVAFVRFPASAPVALLIAAPFRLPVKLGSQEAFLLLPLYAVLAAALGAYAYRALRRSAPPRAAPLVAWPTAALVLLAGLSFLWTRDLRFGAIELVFFYFPFAALLAVVAGTSLRDWSLRALATAMVAMTAVFAAIGLFQAWSHVEILSKQNLQLANAYAPFFRVSSLFQDPSVYGRQVVLGIVLVFALLWLDRMRPAIGVPLIALMAAGLYFSYSQTSEVALFAGVLIVILIAGNSFTRRLIGATAVGLGVAAVVVVLVFAGSDSASRITSDRSQLIRVTLPVYTSHPVAGVGIGSQPLMSRREEHARKSKSKNVSHTTPLTIAAELGTIGLLVYLAFLAGLARAIAFAWQRHRALALSLAGMATALVVHSFAYSGFFEDPFVWGIAGLVSAALAFLPAPAPAPSGEGRGAPRAQPLPAHRPN